MAAADLFLHGPDMVVFSARMPTLVYWDSDGTEKTFELGLEPVLIGRSSECAIRSDDTRVSRRHARVVGNGNSCWIEDLGSANGVYVGSDKVTQAPIPPGEIVVVGSIILQIQPEDGQPPALPNGTHTQLCVWLKIERESRAALIEERNALGQRVSELHRQIEQLSRGAADAELFQAEIDRIRAEAESDKERDIGRLRNEAEMALQEAVQQARAEVETQARETVERNRAEIEAVLQPEIESLRVQLEQARSASEGSAELQKQLRQLWSNLKASKQHISQLEEEAKAYKTRQQAEEEARNKLKAHAKKLATEVKRLRELEHNREQTKAVVEARAVELEERNSELGKQLDGQRELETAIALLKEQRVEAEARAGELAAEVERAREAERAAWGQTEEMGAESERLRAEMREARLLAVEASSLREEREQLRFELDVARAELHELRTSGADAESKYSAELRAAQSRVENLTVKLEEHRAVASEAEQHAAARLAAMQDENARLRDHVNDANTELYKLRSKLERARTEIDEVRAAGAATAEAGQARYAALKAERDRLDGELTSLRKEVAELRRGLESKLEATRTEKSTIEEQRDELAAELSAVRGENAELGAKLRATLETNAKIGEELEELRRELTEGDSRRQAERTGAHAEQQRLEGELRTTRVEADTQRRRADDLQARMDALIIEVDRLRRDVERTRSDAEGAVRDQSTRHEAELERLRAEVARLRLDSERLAEERALRHTAEDRRTALEERVESLERDLSRVSAKANVPAVAREQIMTLHDCVAALRASMRAASDETAVMPSDSPSVQVIVDALSDATEQIERARDSLRSLEGMMAD